MPHRVRPWFSSEHPLHVTVRMVRRCWNLRSFRAFRHLREAFGGALFRFETRLIEFSVQGNHIHFIFESMDRVELGRAMKGLGVRIAKRMNKLMGTRGRVIADRYHVRPLYNGLSVKRALQYVLNNFRHHAAERGETLRAAWLDRYSTARTFNGWRNCTPELRGRTRDPCPLSPPGIAEAQTRLLKYLWRDCGLLDVAHIPGNVRPRIES